MEVIIIVSLAGIASVFFVIMLTLLKVPLVIVIIFKRLIFLEQNIRQLRDTVKSMSRRHILIRNNRWDDHHHDGNEYGNLDYDHNDLNYRDDSDDLDDQRNQEQ